MPSPSSSPGETSPRRVSMDTLSALVVSEITVLAGMVSPTPTPAGAVGLAGQPQVNVTVKTQNPRPAVHGAGTSKEKTGVDPTSCTFVWTCCNWRPAGLHQYPGTRTVPGISPPGDSKEHGRGSEDPLRGTSDRYAGFPTRWHGVGKRPGGEQWTWRWSWMTGREFS